MASQRYIVVGAGLAGCLIAWRLEQAGQAVFLIGNTKLPCASMAAGGIINPVTGRWMTKSWKFDDCIKTAADTYRELERQFKTELYYPMHFIRYCQNNEDVKRVQRRIRNPRYANVLGDYSPTGASQCELTDTHGSFAVNQAAHVDLSQLLQTIRGHFQETRRFQDTTFVHEALKTEDGCWHYNGLEAEHVIFCEGSNIRQNPWFKELPLTPVKGETLTLECPGLSLPKTIYHRSKWLMPVKGGHFKIGATYDEEDVSEEPTEAGRIELLEAYHNFAGSKSAPFVKNHTAGLRPCTKDFRPFIGTHPSIRKLHVFNGLGSKGTLLAPELTKRFLRYLLNNDMLDDAINCTRYL